METYLKEKLKVNMDLLKVYVAIMVIFGGSIISLCLKTNFKLTTFELYLIIIGCILLGGFFIATIKSFVNIHKVLNELKNL